MADDFPGAGAARPFLRLVPEANDPAAAEPESEALGVPSQAQSASTAGPRAAAIRREAQLFGAVRVLSPNAPVGATSPTQTVVGSAVQTETEPEPADLVEDLSTAALGERFSAFLSTQPSSATKVEGPSPEAIQEALNSLQVRSPLAVHPELWPGVSLQLLSRIDPEAAGRWLVCLAPFLHRVAPDTRFDLVIPKVGCLAVSSHRMGTDVEWLSKGRKRRRRDVRVKGSLASVGGAVFSDRSRAVRGVDGLQLLRRLAAAPVSLGDLAKSSHALIDPIAFWKLVSVSIPAGLGGHEALVVHRDPLRPDLSATIEVLPGRPLKVSSQEVRNPDALVEVSAGQLFEWASNSPVDGSGSSFLVEGTGDAEAAALRQIGRPSVPIRSRP